MLCLDVTLTDLRREYERALSQPRHLIPTPKTPATSPRSGADGVIDSLVYAQHVLELFRRTLSDQPVRRSFDSHRQPLVQNPLANPKTHQQAKIGTDWPYMPTFCPGPWSRELPRAKFAMAGGVMSRTLIAPAIRSGLSTRSIPVINPPRVNSDYPRIAKDGARKQPILDGAVWRVGRRSATVIETWNSIIK
jgi:hypothetical protein